MENLTFEFISAYNGKADFRLFVNGRANTRITADSDKALSYGDGSPVLRKEVIAFNAHMGAQWDKARAAYPDLYAETPTPLYRAKESN